MERGATEAKIRGSMWFRGFTVVTLGWYVFFGGLVVVDAGVARSEAIHATAAVLATGIVVAGLLPQLGRPMHNVAAFQQALVTAAAVLIAAAIVGDPDNRGGQAGPFDVVYLSFLVPLVILAVLQPARRELLRAGNVRPALLLLAAVVAVPLMAYGVDQALIQRNSWPPATDPHHNSHWFMTAELAFALPLVAAVAGLGGRGWRVPAWTASAALAGLGMVSVLFPGAASSLGFFSGSLAVLAAGALAAFTVRESRRERIEVEQANRATNGNGRWP